MTSLPLFHVDAFTAEPFRGNPAAVCLLDRPRDAAWMARVAAEMNLSETAFVVPQGDALGLRWFTPALEVKLCGHATLATAHVLWEAGRLPRTQPAVFETLSGRLSARWSDGWIEMDFPAFADSTEGIREDARRALGDAPVRVARTFPRQALGEETAFVEVESEAALRALVPDLSGLRSPDDPALLVTARASMPGADFVSRYFAPCAGVDEDPVTGAAHCVLGPYWVARLGRREVVGYQASARGGFVGIRLEGDRAVLRGQAVTVVRGELAVPAA